MLNPLSTTPRVADPVVHVQQGLLRGRCASGVCRFLKVPFAAPPVGALRWLPPQPPPSWSGTRDATQLGPTCLQVLDPAEPPSGEESCLFLNLWATERCMSGNPSCGVLLWIHGGGYVIGSGINYDGSQNAALAQDVIVVTINYRISALGFLAVPPSPGVSTGNFGLLDQRAAMRWVRDNAAAFGGDARRVTIVGESAGATSVTCHLCSPGSLPLFAGAAMESGAFTYWSARPRADGAAQYARLLNATRCADVSCLRAMDAARLTAIASNRSLGFAVLAHKMYATTWAPTVDGVVLADLPHRLLARGACAADRPLLLGVNRDEGTSSVGAPDEPLLAKGLNMTAADLRAFLLTWLRNATLVEEALAVYAAADATGRMPPPVGAAEAGAAKAGAAVAPYWAATHFTGDLLFACPAMRAARHYGALARLYFFDHVPLNPPFDAGVPTANGSYVPGTAGVSHAYEMQFVWQGLPQAEWAPGGTLVGRGEAQLSETIARFWTNFARSGDPNAGPRAPLTIEWPRAGGAARPNGSLTALELRLPALSVVTGRGDRRCAFVDRLGPLAYPEVDVERAGS